jgi:hypothetical protein
VKDILILILVLVIINFVIIIKVNNENHSERLFILENKVEALNDIVSIMFYKDLEYEEDDGTFD